MVDDMEFDYPGFGRIVVDGEIFDHDVILEGGQIRARDKTPSRRWKSRYGHTPLTAEEDIPWSGHRLIIGSGHSGRLPILGEVEEMAESKGVEIEVMLTSEACDLLSDADLSDVASVLHVTC